MIDVLIIHPDPKLASIYRANSRFTIDSAVDGLTGLRKIKSLMPHAVISEFDLPYLSGLSLLKFVRSHPALQTVPFLFLSRQPLHPHALEWGANEWIMQDSSHSEHVLGRVAFHLVQNRRLIKASKLYE